MKRTPIKHCSPRRRAEVNQYRPMADEYLREHPWCEIFLAEYGLRACDVSDTGWATIYVPEDPENIGTHRIHVPHSIEVHHRNQRHGSRLVDKRWWMAVSRSCHEYMKQYPKWARNQGYLLPQNADKDGRVAGVQALTIEEIIKRNHDRIFVSVRAPGVAPRAFSKPFDFYGA